MICFDLRQFKLGVYKFQMLGHGGDLHLRGGA